MNSNLSENRPSSCSKLVLSQDPPRDFTFSEGNFIGSSVTETLEMNSSLPSCTGQQDDSDVDVVLPRGSEGSRSSSISFYKNLEGSQMFDSVENRVGTLPDHNPDAETLGDFSTSDQNLDRFYSPVDTEAQARDLTNSDDLEKEITCHDSEPSSPFQSTDNDLFPDSSSSLWDSAAREMPLSSSKDWPSMSNNVQVFWNSLPPPEESCPQVSNSVPLTEEIDAPLTFSFSTGPIVPTMVGAGLRNLGNTCFLNAVLQCLTHTTLLVNGVRSCNHSSPCGVSEGFCVLCALREHIELSLSCSGGVLSPVKLVDNLNYISSDFRRYQQEDAHEFLHCFLEKLDECLTNPKMKGNDFSRDDKLVEQIFGGQLISRLRCCNCGRCSDTHEPLIDLSLEIEDVDTLSSALESFTKVENIDGKFKCENCKEEVSMEKQFMLNKAPPVAAFQFKRFKTLESYVEKVDKHVEFPLELDLAPYTTYCQKNATLKYDLYAIVVHVGYSSSSGHYFSFVRSSPDTWHRLDDSLVTKVGDDSVLSQNAYMLFYTKRGTPWFSSIMEVQKSCRNPSGLSTSPTSILDYSDVVPGSDSGGEHAKGCDDIEVTEADEHCERLGESSIKSCLDNTRDLSGQCTSETMQRNATFENDILREIDDTGENDTFHPLTPPRSPSPDLCSPGTNNYSIPRKHLKLENERSSDRSSNKIEDFERKEAIRYLNKSSVSCSKRKQKLMEAMPAHHQRAGTANKRSKKVDSPLLKSNILPSRQRSHHGSVARPVALR